MADTNLPPSHPEPRIYDIDRSQRRRESGSRVPRSAEIAAWIKGIKAGEFDDIAT